MDEKANNRVLEQAGNHARPVRARVMRFRLAALVLIALFWLASHCHKQMRTILNIPSVTLSSKVPLEAHIMSKCPDARDCLRDLILPTMQNVSDKVDFTLSYIGKVSNDDDGVECKHGQTECLGNILELCAAHLYPDPKIYLGFTMCLSKNYDQIPQREMVADCALEHGIEFDSLNHCVSHDDGAFGIGLLRDSVERSAKANVTYSCTVRLNEKIRCIRDGGEWKDCKGGSSVESLIRDINNLYGKR